MDDLDNMTDPEWWKTSSSGSYAENKGAQAIRYRLQRGLTPSSSPPAQPSRFSDPFAAQVPFELTQPTNSGTVSTDNALPLPLAHWDQEQVSKSFSDSEAESETNEMPPSAQPRVSAPIPSPPSTVDPSDQLTAAEHNTASALTSLANAASSDKLPTLSQAVAILTASVNSAVHDTADVSTFSAIPPLANSPLGSVPIAPSTAHVNPTPPATSVLVPVPRPQHSSTPASASASSTSSSAPSSHTSDWPLKKELSGTQAHFYRGPLPASEVLSLLRSSSISKNGRQSLTGTRVGYLAFWHFIGPSDVPSPQSRASTSKKAGVAREAWRCKVCHHELHVPCNQISNLGTHLYGVQSKAKEGAQSKTQRGCLELRAHDPAETIPVPERDAKGDIIRLGAGSSAPRSKKALSTSA
ncbi:hypothetical protein CF319_g7809 [Tilletia indica]|nr:hypothetical protein CF319_g7809 [Tilletia indica]